jgi:hypothetical protein
MVGDPVHQGLVQPSRVEKREGKMRRQDDVGVGPAHEPQAEVGGMIEDSRRQFYRVLQSIHEGMWAHIKDEEFLE